MARFLRAQPPQPVLGPPLYLSPLAKPTTAGHLQVKTTCVAVRTLAEQPRHAPHSRLGSPLYLFVPAVPPLAEPISVALAGRTRLEDSRRRVCHVLGRPFYLSPLAKVITPGQLAIRSSLAAVRDRTERQRRDVQTRLSAPAALQVFSGPTITLADRPTRLQPRYEPFSRLSLPIIAAAATFAAPPVSVVIPLRGQARRRQSALTLLRPPTALQIFGGPAVTLAGRTRLEDGRRHARSTLGGAFYLSPLVSVINPARLAVALAAVRDRVERARHAPRSALGKPTTLRVFTGPSVTLAVAASLFAPRRFPLQGWEGLGGLPPIKLIDAYDGDAGQSDGILGDVGSSEAEAQSFTGAGGQLAYIQAHLTVLGSPTDGVSCSLFTDVGGKPGALIEQAATVIAGGALPLNPATFYFSGGTNLASGTIYWLVFARTGARDASNFAQIERATASYDNGKSTRKDNGTWGSGNNFDFRFRVATYDQADAFAWVQPLLGPRRPLVVRPRASRQQQTLAISLIDRPARLQPRYGPFSRLAAPTVVAPAVAYFGPSVTLGGRGRLEASRRAPRSFLRAPTVIRVPSVEQQEQTIRVTLAGRTRVELQRRDVQARLSPPTALQVFGGPSTWLAGRTRLEQQRRASHWALRPPRVVRVPSVEQAEDTVRVTLAGRTRLEQQRRVVLSKLGEPTMLQAFYGPRVNLAPRARGDFVRREPLSFLRPPIVVRVPSVEQAERTVGVTLAAVRARQPRYGPRSRLSGPFYLSPLAKVTTPGQLSIRRTLVAVRTAVEQQRHFARYKLFPGIVGRNPFRPAIVVLAGRTRLEAQRRAPRSFLGEPQALRVFAGPRVTLAGRNRDDRIRRTPHSELSPPTVVRVPSVEQARQTIRVELAPSRRVLPHSRLRGPVVVASPPPPRDEALSTALVAVRGRLEGRRTPHSRLSPPTVLAVFSGPRAPLVRRVQSIRPTFSVLRRPAVVATPPPPREEGVTSSLVAVRTASEVARRFQGSHLRPVVPARRPLVTRILAALAAASPLLRRGPKSKLRPPLVVSTPTPPLVVRAGIGGSGISDEEYERLLRRLGALPQKLDLSGLDLEEALFVLKMMGLL